MNITIEYLGVHYTLIYNSQSGYYEIELDATQAGVNQVSIQATDLFENIETQLKSIQVFAVDTDISKYKEKDIVYIFSHEDLSLKDIRKITNYTLELDDETNESSVIEFPNYFEADEKDYILIKKEGDSFLGIFKDLTEIKNNESYEAQIQDISNIFDEKIFLWNENLIKTTGIEDFIKSNIEHFFSSSYDSFTNLEYIKVTAKTHTILQKSVDTDDGGMYNFHTFITNCKQNYLIFIDYKIKNKELLINIERKEQEQRYIDCTVADILNYKKIFGNQILSKVEVLCKDTNQVKVYCLDLNRNVLPFNEISTEDRVDGKTERITVDNNEEAYQNAIDRFKGNDYNYLIQFSLRRDSNLMNTDNLKVGTPVKIKTKENIVVRGYITARTERKDERIIDFKAGKIRRTLRQQLKKEALT